VSDTTLCYGQPVTKRLPRYKCIIVATWGTVENQLCIRAERKRWVSAAKQRTARGDWSAPQGTTEQTGECAVPENCWWTSARLFCAQASRAPQWARLYNAPLRLSVWRWVRRRTTLRRGAECGLGPKCDGGWPVSSSDTWRGVSPGATGDYSCLTGGKRVSTASQMVEPLTRHSGVLVGASTSDLTRRMPSARIGIVLRALRGPCMTSSLGGVQ